MHSQVSEIQEQRLIYVVVPDDVFGSAGEGSSGVLIAEVGFLVEKEIQGAVLTLITEREGSRIEGVGLVRKVDFYIASVKFHPT